MKMKQKLLLFAFTLISAMLFSQVQNMAFEDFKTNDGTQNFFYKNVVKTDASGNIYTLGATTTSNSTTDILLTKKNSSGTTLWTKQINGSANYHDFGAGLTVTTSGDVYITGAITNNTTTLAPELIIRKYNSSGTQQFSTTYSGAGYGCVGKDIVVDASGNSFITGAEYNSGFTADILTIAFGSTGTQLWADLFDNNSLNDGGVKIAFRSNKVTVTGAVTQSTNNYKIATITFTASTGVRSETITLGSTMTSSVEIVTGMTTDASGNTYLCGATEVSGQGYNMYVAKLTSSLTIAWQQTYNGTNNLDDMAKGIQVDASGNVYITGYSTSSTQGKDIRTIKYNSSGTLQWNNVINSTINGNDQAYDMEIDASSNIYVVGSIASTNGNLLDYYTVKYNNSGTKIWDIQTDGSHLNDQATNIALDSLNNIIVTGESETSPNTYVYTTCKYVQKDVITPTDFNLETPSNQRLYYPNRGQLINTGDTLVPEIKYYTQNTYPSFYFKDKSQSYVFSKIDTVIATNDTLHRIDLKFTNSSESAKIYSMEEQHQNYFNYFFSHTPSKGVTKIYGNQRLITPDLYSNIDLMSSSNQNGIKYYFIVKPGGDMRNIKLEFTGASSFSLNGTTNALSINSSIGSITFDKPIAYQLTAANATVAVTSFSPTWTIDGASNKYKFNDGAYTTSLTLVIEVDQGNASVNNSSANQDIDWSTFYSSSGNDWLRDITADKVGNVHVCGYTDKTDFPILGVNSIPYSGFTDAVIMKFNTNAVRQWATFYGNASGQQCVSGIGDTLGNYYITGNTQSTVPFPPTQPVGAFVDNTSGGSTDIYVARFDSLGVLTWATLYGNGNTEQPAEIDMDKNGNIFVVGNSGGSFPVVTKPNALNSAIGNGFILKFNSALQIDWATNFGSTANNGDIKSIEFDPYTADVYVTGNTFNNFHIVKFSGGANDTTYNGGTNGDAFISCFNATQDTLVWSTYIGGSQDDDGGRLKCRKGDVFLSGSTKSGNFPFKHSANQYFDTISGGVYKPFIMRFNTLDKKLKWSTGFNTNGASLGVDNKNNLVVTGSVNNTLPTVQSTGSYWQNTNAGSLDSYISVFNAYDSLIYSTYIGGSKSDEYFKSAFFNDYVYLVGSTLSNQTATTIFPLSNLGGTPPAYWQDTYTKAGPFSYGGQIARFNFTNTLHYVGIDEFKKSTLDNLVTLYPNPNNGNLYLKFNANFNEKIIIEIFDILGHNVFAKQLSSVNKNQIENINITDFASGMYLVKISTETHSECLKLVKQ
jgi:hypothetical protein